MFFGWSYKVSNFLQTHASIKGIALFSSHSTLTVTQGQLYKFRILFKSLSLQIYKISGYIVVIIKSGRLLGS